MEAILQELKQEAQLEHMEYHRAFLDSVQSSRNLHQQHHSNHHITEAILQELTLVAQLEHMEYHLVFLGNFLPCLLLHSRLQLLHLIHRMLGNLVIRRELVGLLGRMEYH